MCLACNILLLAPFVIGLEKKFMMSLGGFYVGFSSQSNQAREFYMLLFKILEDRDWVSAVLSSGLGNCLFLPWN